MKSVAEQFGDTVKKLRKARGWTIYYLAELAGIDKGHLSRIERGTRNPPKADAIKHLADALDVPFDYLLARSRGTAYGTGEPFTDEDLLREIEISSPARSTAISKSYLEGLKERFPDFQELIEFVVGQATMAKVAGNMRNVPVIGLIAAGSPTGYQSLETGETLMLPAAELPGDPDLFAVRVVGESMVGSRVEENDVVIISPAQKGLLKVGDIAAVRVGEEGITLKEVHNYPDGLILRSSNPDFPDLTFDQADIIGKAIRLIKVTEL
jgi:SOS-response transcriptional repressor LexA